MTAVSAGHIILTLKKKSRERAATAGIENWTPPKKKKKKKKRSEHKRQRTRTMTG